jgi:hypothetical protein
MMLLSIGRKTVLKNGSVVVLSIWVYKTKLFSLGRNMIVHKTPVGLPVTVHGSLDSSGRISSRSSITWHFIPQSLGFFQFQSRLLKTLYDQVKQVKIFRPKDLAKYRNKLIFLTESMFSRQFYWIRGIAIKLVVSKNKAL